MSLLQVALHVLQLLNELVAMDMKALGTVSLLSVVPAAAQYAAGRGPPEIVRTSDLRLQAALFLQHLAKMNLVTAQLLITCQARALPADSAPVAVLAFFSAARSSAKSCSLHGAPRQLLEGARPDLVPWLAGPACAGWAGGVQLQGPRAPGAHRRQLHLAAAGAARHAVHEPDLPAAGSGRHCPQPGACPQVRHCSGLAAGVEGTSYQPATRPACCGHHSLLLASRVDLILSG